MWLLCAHSVMQAQVRCLSRSSASICTLSCASTCFDLPAHLRFACAPPARPATIPVAMGSKRRKQALEEDPTLAYTPATYALALARRLSVSAACISGCVGALCLCVGATGLRVCPSVCRLKLRFKLLCAVARASLCHAGRERVARGKRHQAGSGRPAPRRNAAPPPRRCAPSCTRRSCPPRPAPGSTRPRSAFRRYSDLSTAFTSGAVNTSHLPLVTFRNFMLLSSLYISFPRTSAAVQHLHIHPQPQRSPHVYLLRRAVCALCVAHLVCDTTPPAHLKVQMRPEAPRPATAKTALVAYLLALVQHLSDTNVQHVVMHQRHGHVVHGSVGNSQAPDFQNRSRGWNPCARGLRAR